MPAKTTACTAQVETDLVTGIHAEVLPVCVLVRLPSALAVDLNLPIHLGAAKGRCPHQHLLHGRHGELDDGAGPHRRSDGHHRRRPRGQDPGRARPAPADPHRPSASRRATTMTSTPPFPAPCRRSPPPALGCCSLLAQAAAPRLRGRRCGARAGPVLTAVDTRILDPLFRTWLGGRGRRAHPERHLPGRPGRWPASWPVLRRSAPSGSRIGPTSRTIVTGVRHADIAWRPSGQ